MTLWALALVGVVSAQEGENVTPEYPTLVPTRTQVPVRPKSKHWDGVPLTRTSGGRFSQVVECAFEADVNARGKITEVRSNGCPAAFEKAGMRAAKAYLFEPWPSSQDAEATTTLLEFRWIRHP
jgi:hypothetical protein